MAGDPNCVDWTLFPATVYPDTTNDPRHDVIYAQHIYSLRKKTDNMNDGTVTCSGHNSTHDETVDSTKYVTHDGSLNSTYCGSHYSADNNNHDATHDNGHYSGHDSSYNSGYDGTHYQTHCSTLHSTYDDSILTGYDSSHNTTYDNDQHGTHRSDYDEYVYGDVLINTRINHHYDHFTSHFDFIYDLHFINEYKDHCAGYNDGALTSDTL